MPDTTDSSDPFARPPLVDSAPDTAPDTARAAPAVVAAKATPWKLVIGIVAAVAVVVGGVVLLTGGDDDNSSGAGGAGGGDAAEGEWHLARYVGDEAAAIEVLNSDLEVERTVSLETDGGPALNATIGRYLVTEAEGNIVEVLDLADGGSRTVTLPEGDLIIDRGVQAAGGGYAVYFSPSGGSLTLVDLAGASADNIGSADGRYFPGGQRPGFSMYFDPEGGGTVVVPHNDPSSWWEVPGPVAFVEGRRTLVLGMVDGEPAIRAFDGDQQQGETVRMKAPQLGGVLTENGAMTVDTGGGLWSVDLASGEFESLGVLGIGIDAAVPIGSDRVMAWGAAGTRVVMVDGTITEELEPLADADGEMQPLVPVNGGIGTDCITVQPGQRLRPSEARAVTVDLATSEGIVTFTGTPYGFSADGCTAISMAAPSELMIDGTLVDLSLDRVFAVSPDHTQVIGAVISDGAQIYLVDVASGERTGLPQGAYFWTRF